MIGSRARRCPSSWAARTVGDDVIEAVLVETSEQHRLTLALVDPGPGQKARNRPRDGGPDLAGLRAKTLAEDSFKVSPDPDLMEKVRDLVGFYMSPPVATAVFAVDEKPQIQALNRTAPTLPMLPTTPARANHDYERNGTCDLFAALDIASGKVITDIRVQHTSDDFLAFLSELDRNVPAELEVHLILDNLHPQDPQGPPMALAP